MGQPTYNLKNIRKMITAVFSDEELRNLCRETPVFRPVSEQFSTGMAKTEMVRRLIEFSERKGLMKELLAMVQEEVPARYAEFADTLVEGDAPTEVSGSSISEDGRLRMLIDSKTRQLFELQKQEAVYGLATPPHIKIQIEDLETEINQLKQRLADVELTKGFRELSLVEQNKRDRDALLCALYEKSGGNTSKMINLWELGNELGFSPEEAKQTMRYLLKRKLLEATTNGIISITDSGIDRAETILST